MDDPIWAFKVMIERLKKAVEEYFEQALGEDELCRATRDPWDGRQMEEHGIGFDIHYSELKEALGLSDYSLVIDGVDRMIGETGLAVDEGTDEYKILCRFYLHAYIQFVEITNNRDGADYSDEPRIAIPATGPDQSKESRPKTSVSQIGNPVGRPGTNYDALRGELQRMDNSGEVFATGRSWRETVCRSLFEWYGRKYPKKHQPQTKTIKGALMVFPVRDCFNVHNQEGVVLHLTSAHI